MTVEDADQDGTLVLSGVVDTAEARDAATDIVAAAAPGRRIDNQLEVETVLPTDVDDFVGDETSAELADDTAEIGVAGGEMEPDFTDQPRMGDPIDAAGPSSSGPDDVVSGGDAVYTPPTDPVVSTDARGRAYVLGGFDSEPDPAVEPSASDEQPGDEALADAIRRELREDAATTDLQIVVAVRRGVAHLRGRVPGLEDADNAEAVAARVPGVREVVEELDVLSG